MDRRKLLVLALCGLPSLSLGGRHYFWNLDADRYLLELTILTKKLRNGLINQNEWCWEFQELSRKIDLPAFLKDISFEKLRIQNPIPKRLLVSWPVLAQTQIFGPTTVIGIRKGRSIGPHAHRNRITAFHVLQGKARLRQYDKILMVNKSQMIIRPRVDRIIEAGDSSTVNDHNLNIHWVSAIEDTYLLCTRVQEVSPLLKVGLNYQDFIDIDRSQIIRPSILSVPIISKDESYTKYYSRGA